MSIEASMVSQRARELQAYAKGAGIICLVETGDIREHGFGSMITAFSHSAEKLLPFVPSTAREVQHFIHGEEFIDEVHELRLGSRVAAEILEKASHKWRIAIVGHDGWDKPFWTIAVIPKSEVSAAPVEDEFDFGT